MLAKFAQIIRIPELRWKLFITFVLLFMYRLGHFIVLPLVNQEVMKKNFEALQKSGDGLGAILKVAEVFSGSTFGMTTIFGLGIMPYISASIILQLMASVYPPLEALQKEGEVGRKKINDYTRYLTVILSFVQSWAYLSMIGNSQNLFIAEYNTFFPFFVCVVTMTTGTLLLMWIGEQIDHFGIGNGISLIIMAGILSRVPQVLRDLFGPIFSEGLRLEGDRGVPMLIGLVGLFVLVVWGVIFITQGQRHIATQSQKHQRGRRVWGGHRQTLPLRVNQSGVMPIIFASSMLMFPAFLFHLLEQATGFSLFNSLKTAFGEERGYLYNTCYVALIYFFCYMWTGITFNPKDIAENLKNYGSLIPGRRPGRQTAEYLERVMTRITYVGAGFLAVVAVIPTIVVSFMKVDMATASFFGGTSLLIVVSVGLDLVQKIDSHLVMRNYSGLLEQ
jgi:preprotein translocase subunit SecY